MPDRRTLLRLSALFIVIGASGTAPVRAEDASTSPRERFVNLLLGGNDPITERARQRSSDPRGVLAKSGAVRSTARADSSNLRTAALPVASGAKPSAESQTALERRAIRLTKQLARIERNEQKLREAYRPDQSASQSIWLRHGWMRLLPEQYETTAELRQVERQLASPTTPSVAVDALKLGRSDHTRHRIEHAAPAPKARRREDVAKPARRAR